MLRVFIGAALVASVASGAAFAQGSNPTATSPGNGQEGVSNPGAKPPAPAAVNVLEGRVEQVDLAHNLTIAGSERAGLAFEKFKLEPGSEITVNGQRASIDDLNEGDEVRASFSRSGNELRVQRLDIRSGKTTAGNGPRAP